MLFRPVLFVLVVTAALSAQTYSNLDQKTNLDNGSTSSQGWGWCTSTACAGGAAAATEYKMYWFQRPSVDSSGSAQFFISGPAHSNALWWHKLGANNTPTRFKLSFWVSVDQNTSTNVEALEFDAFQFTNGLRYMFGTQCNYSLGVWDIWDEGRSLWLHTKIPCPKLVPGNWYRIVWTFRRGNTSSGPRIRYDTLNVTEYAADHRTVVSGPKTYTLGTLTSPSPLPSGWGNNLGAQFQLDLNSKGGSATMWVDQITLTAAP